MLFKIFLIGLPVVLLLAMATSYNESLTTNEFINGFSGLTFGLWMTLALLLSTRLIFSADSRTLILARLSLFKERDEPERSSSQLWPRVMPF